MANTIMDQLYEIAEKVYEIKDEIKKAFEEGRVLDAYEIYNSGHAVWNAWSEEQYVKYKLPNGKIREVKLFKKGDNGYNPDFHFIEVELCVDGKCYPFRDEEYGSPSDEFLQEKGIVEDLFLFDSEEIEGFMTTYYETQSINFGSYEKVYSPRKEKLVKMLDELGFEGTTDGFEKIYDGFSSDVAKLFNHLKRIENALEKIPDPYDYEPYVIIEGYLGDTEEEETIIEGSLSEVVNELENDKELYKSLVDYDILRVYIYDE